MEAFGRELKALAEAGCRYVQIDETAFAKFGDPEVQAALKSRGDDWSALIDKYVAITNRVLKDAPQGMRGENAWLINGAEVWETVPQPLQTFAVDRVNHLSLSVRDGPIWDPGAKVDVVLQFSTSSGTYFIQQRGVQVIGAL